MRSLLIDWESILICLFNVFLGGGGEFQLLCLIYFLLPNMLTVYNGIFMKWNSQ